MNKIFFPALVFFLTSFCFPSFAQQQVERTIKTNDSCQYLSAALQLNNIAPYYNKWMLLDAFDCIDKERLILNPVNSKNQSFTWLSFPRLNRNGADPKVNEVLGGSHIDPDNYENNSQLENVPPDAISSVFNIYTIPTWPDGGLLDKIYSPRGYKLTLDYLNQEGTEPHLYLDGTVLSPSTPVTLYAGEDKENWTGYWLYPSQNIFDALGDAVDNLYSIEHQDWTCLKGLHYGIEPPDPTAEHLWYCDKTSHNIRFGEMVILKSSQDFNFVWNNSGVIPLAENPGQTPTFYSYEEQASYTPFIIELDSADNPIEMGAFINDTCIGATVVNPGDSIVVMRVYMENSTSDSVTFEKYYGTKSSARNRIRDYSVWDKNSKAFIKRALHANERGDSFFISLKNRKQENVKSNANAAFTVWPNPASGTLFYSIVLEEDAIVTVSLFDIAGRLLARPIDELFSPGSLSGEIALSDENGRKLTAGIYFVQLKAGNIFETKKVIVN